MCMGNWCKDFSPKIRRSLYYHLIFFAPTGRGGNSDSNRGNTFARSGIARPHTTAPDRARLRSAKMASWGVSPSPKDRTRPQPTTKGKGNKANWGYSYQPTIEENPFSDWADTHRHMASPSRQRPTATTKEKPRWKRSTDTTDQFPRLADSPARAYGRSGAETGGGVFTPRGGGKETWKRYDLPPLGTAQLDETVVKGTLGPRISNPQSSFGKQTLWHKKNEPATVFSRTDRVAASRLFVRSDNPNRHVQDSVEQAEFYEG